MGPGANECDDAGEPCSAQGPPRAAGILADAAGRRGRHAPARPALPVDRRAVHRAARARLRRLPRRVGEDGALLRQRLRHHCRQLLGRQPDGLFAAASGERRRAVHAAVCVPARRLVRRRRALPAGRARGV